MLALSVGDRAPRADRQRDEPIDPHRGRRANKSFLPSGVAKRCAMASSGVGLCGAGGAGAKRSSKDG
jgi:hypothetical protein